MKYEMSLFLLPLPEYPFHPALLFHIIRRYWGRSGSSEIPKLVFAGSSPVARSMNFPTLPSGGVFF